MLLSGDGGKSSFAHLDLQALSHRERPGRIFNPTAVNIYGTLLNQSAGFTLAGCQFCFNYCIE
jgi:hypothetical protein